MGGNVVVPASEKADGNVKYSFFIISPFLNIEEIFLLSFYYTF